MSKGKGKVQSKGSVAAHLSAVSRDTTAPWKKAKRADRSRGQSKDKGKGPSNNVWELLEHTGKADSADNTLNESRRHDPVDMQGVD